MLVKLPVLAGLTRLRRAHLCEINLGYHRLEHTLDLGVNRIRGTEQHQQFPC